MIIEKKLDAFQQFKWFNADLAYKEFGFMPAIMAHAVSYYVSNNERKRFELKIWCSKLITRLYWKHRNQEKKIFLLRFALHEINDSVVKKKSGVWGDLLPDSKFAKNLNFNAALDFENGSQAILGIVNLDGSSLIHAFNELEAIPDRNYIIIAEEDTILDLDYQKELLRLYYISKNKFNNFQLYLKFFAKGCSIIRWGDSSEEIEVDYFFIE
jgi:hypothetical protein